MPLKAVVNDLEDVPEGVRDFYESDGDGYRLSVEGLSSEGPTEDDLREVKGALAKANKEAMKRRKETEAWEALGMSRDEIAELIAEQEEAEQRKAEQRGEWEKLKGQLQEKHQEQLTEATRRAERAEQRLRQKLIDVDALQALEKHGAYTKLMLDQVRKFVDVIEEDGRMRVIVLDGNGDRRLNDQGNNMTIDELVAEMKEDEEYSAGFKPSGKSGGGAADGSAAGARNGKVRSKADLRTRMDKVLFIKEHGDEAFLALPDN